MGLISNYFSNLFFILLYGTVPTVVLFLTSDTNESFFRKVKSFQTLDPLVYYFGGVYLFFLFILIFFKITQGKSLYFNNTKILEAYEASSSSFKWIFQSTSGIILSFSFLIPILDPINTRTLLLIFLMLFISVITLSPVLLLRLAEKKLYNDDSKGVG